MTEEFPEQGDELRTDPTPDPDPDPAQESDPAPAPGPVAESDDGPPPLRQRWKWVLGLTLGAIALGVLGCVVLKGANIPGTKIGMAIATMVLLVVGWVVDRRQAWKAGMVVTALLGSMVITTAYVADHKKTHRLLVDHRIHAWNVFHYVLGTKYFDEVGYFDLYLAAFKADAEGKNIFGQARRTRDMHTYDVISRKRALAMADELQVKENFSAKRWKQFRKDLRQIQRHRSAKGWTETVLDLGYNPSPAWLIVHRPLLNYYDVSKRKTLAHLCSLELIMYLVLIAVAWWGFGGRYAMVASMWVLTYFGNANLLVGSYFHYDWLFFTVLAVVLYKKGYPILSAPVLAYVAMMRGFPGLLAIFPGIAWIRELIRTRRLPRKYTAFCLTLAVSCGAMVALGSTTERGFGAWSEWRDKISIHSHHHPLFAKRVGLKRMFVHDYKDGRWHMRIDKRKEVMERNKPAFDTVKWTLIALCLLAMIRRRDLDGMLLGMAVAFLLLVTSRYYVSVWILMLAWTPMDRRQIGNLVASLALFGGILFYHALEGFPKLSTWKTYYYFNAYMLAFFMVIIVGFLIADVRAKLRPT